LKQIGWVFEVLHVLKHDESTRLGPFPQMVHHAGFACPPGGCQQNMFRMEFFPELLDEFIAKPKVLGWHNRTCVEVSSHGVHLF
jgi:hypothetical protein